MHEPVKLVHTLFSIVVVWDTASAEQFEPSR